MQLLFYKMDRLLNQPANVDDSLYELTIQHMTEEQCKKIDEQLNEQQMLNNHVLRSVLTFEDANVKNHFLFYQKFEGDKIYLVYQTPQFLSEYLAQFQSIKNQKTPGVDEQKQKEELVEKFSDNLSKQEQSLSNVVCSIIVNNDFSDSPVILTK